MGSSTRVPVPLVLRMAAHPLRWALMTELASSDRRVRELADAVGEPQNLVSYHLRHLRTAGLVDARRSSFDGRDSYYRLDLSRCATAFGEAAAALHPALGPAAPEPPKRGSVLFLCTGNSSRSPMAAALLQHRAPGIEVTSAGSHPAPRLHPNTARVLRADYGIELDHAPRALDTLTGRRFDHVITLCDKVREFAHAHGPAATAHWSLPDPAAGGTHRATYPEFRRVATEIDTRLAFLTW